MCKWVCFPFKCSSNQVMIYALEHCCGEMDRNCFYIILDSSIKYMMHRIELNLKWNSSVAIKIECGFCMHFIVATIYNTENFSFKIWFIILFFHSRFFFFVSGKLFSKRLGRNEDLNMMELNVLCTLGTMSKVSFLIRLYSVELIWCGSCTYFQTIQL